MSTRCTINFCEGRTVIAKVYRHSDGYPDGPHGVPASLEQFFAAVEEQTQDRRFEDATYLAAKYVVWQAGENGKGLNFLGVGIMTHNPDDIEWTYRVNCAALDAAGRPKVTHRRPR